MSPEFGRARSGGSIFVVGGIVGPCAGGEGGAEEIFVFEEVHDAVEDDAAGFFGEVGELAGDEFGDGGAGFAAVGGVGEKVVGLTGDLVDDFA